MNDIALINTIGILNKTKKNSRLSIIGLYLYAFFIFYVPEIGVYVPIQTAHLLFLIFGINVVFGLKRIIIFIQNESIILLYVGLALSVLYSLFMAILKQRSSASTNMLFLLQIINVLFLISRLKSKHYAMIDIFRFLLNLGTIQSIICLLMFIIPSFREIAINLYLDSSPTKLGVTYTRIYGISSGYVFMTPSFHAILGTLAAILAVEINWKYLLYIPFLVFAILINGRIGLVIMIVGIGIAYMTLLIKRSNIKKIFSYISLFSISCLLIIQILKIVQPITYEWIIDGIDQILLFLFKGEATGNMVALSDTMVFFPEGWSLLIGEGQAVFGSLGRKIGYSGSDIGYVNDLFIGGLIYILILYTTIFAFILNKCNKVRHNKLYRMNRALSFAFISILLVANIKGECMRGGAILLCMIAIKATILNEMHKFKI